MKTVPIRDPKESLDHVLYEMEMLRETLREYRTARKGTLANALLESFVIHGRNLGDFFRAKRPNRDFMRSRDFVPDFELLTGGWRTLDKMNVEIAHLSYRRRRPEAEERAGWDLKAVARPLIEKSVEFLKRMMADGPAMMAHGNGDRCAELLAAFTEDLKAPVLDMMARGTTSYTGTTSMTIQAAESGKGCTGPAGPRGSAESGCFHQPSSTSQPNSPSTEHSTL